MANANVNEVRIDVSEIKSFKGCRRKWQFTSRNRFHLTSKVPAKALALGTLFHEALAQLYSGAQFEAVMKLVEQEMTADDKPLIAMLRGYVDEVLPTDLEMWQVHEVEHVFRFPSGVRRVHKDRVQCTNCAVLMRQGIEPAFEKYSAGVAVCPLCQEGILEHCVDEIICTGAIDLIVYEEDTNTVKGIEHKTCAKFRENAFGWLDEQPRVYYEALNRWILQAKEDGRVPRDATNGGIIINEVKKLLRDFQYKRTVCAYSLEDHSRFWEMWLQELTTCYNTIKADAAGEPPTPSYFGCQMCEFKDVCATYGYEVVTKETLLEKYALEFKERKKDHLEEKKALGESVGEDSD